MIKILCVGKIKEPFFKEAIKEYQKRISRFTKLEIIELPDSKIDSPIALKKEKEEILKHINFEDEIVSLAIEGEEYNTINFTSFLENSLSRHNVTFIIGGYYGIDEEIKAKSNHLISFSKLTFPHQLFRVILLEQVYRAFKIINKEQYHK